MSRWIDIGAVDDFADGAMKAVTVEGHDLLVAQVGGRLYAADERCPHMGGHLARGALEGTVVRCPRHGSRFDLADGSVVQWTEWSGAAVKLAKIVKPPKPLQIHTIEVKDGRVVVEV